MFAFLKVFEEHPHAFMAGEDELGQNAASLGDHMSVNTNNPPCISNVPARTIGTYENKLIAKVKNRNKVTLFRGDMIGS
jgi:hypothetical protein